MSRPHVSNGNPGVFEPPVWLKSPHLQTVVGSRGRGFWVAKRAENLLAANRQQVLTLAGGVRLSAEVALKPEAAPAVLLLHGWLGHAESDYVVSAAAELWHAGFSVLRLNLRDHGSTAHLNEAMFHSARIDEVVAAVLTLQGQHQLRSLGIAGFSLGGNFALRVARATGLPTVAIGPAIDPQATMSSIDSGLAIYRWFFVRKWQRALSEKQRAFPDLYEFDRARSLSTVSALTDLFVREHTEFGSTREYFDAYSLTDNALAETDATIVFAEDDPVIPAAGFSALPSHLDLVPVRYGGHCAFIEHPARPTWTDRFLVTHFGERLFDSHSVV